jgi:exonuclease III
MINRHGQIIWHHYNSQQRGVALYFANDLVPYLTDNKLSDNEGRILIVKTTLYRTDENGVDKSHTWIGAIYAPNIPAERKTFFKDTLSTLLAQIPSSDRVILAGDFNNVITALDKHGGNPVNGYDGASELLQTIGTHLLCDAWREFHPEEIGWTHSLNRNTRLDNTTGTTVGEPPNLQQEKMPASFPHHRCMTN